MENLNSRVDRFQRTLTTCVNQMNRRPHRMLQAAAAVAQNDVNRTMLTFDRSKYRHYQSYRMKHHQMYNQPWKHHSVHIPLLSMFCGMSGNMVLVVENQQVNLQSMNAAWKAARVHTVVVLPFGVLSTGWSIVDIRQMMHVIWYMVYMVRICQSRRYLIGLYRIAKTIRFMLRYGNPLLPIPAALR